MYQADQTQSTLMQAMSNLDRSRAAIDAGKWAAQMLTLLLTSSEVGALDANIAFLKTNADRVRSIADLFTEGTEAIKEATSALHLARTMIPNTTPPHPGGLETLAEGEAESHEESAASKENP